MVPLFEGKLPHGRGNGRQSVRRSRVLELKALPAFIESAPEMITPSDVALAAFHLSRYVRSKAEKAA